MTESEKLEMVRDFLYEKGLVSKFIKWIEAQELEDNEEFDIKEWMDDFGG